MEKCKHNCTITEIQNGDCICVNCKYDLSVQHNMKTKNKNQKKKNKKSEKYEKYEHIRKQRKSKSESRFL
jgi:hypothetical protein